MVLVAFFACKRKGVSLFDVVPMNAEVIVESADSAVIAMFDTLMGAHINKELIKNGQQMAIVKMPEEKYQLLAKPSKNDIQDQKIYDDPDFARLQKTLGQNVKAHYYYHHPNGWMMLDVLSEDNCLVMNGYAIAADSASAWRPLKYQLPVKNSVVNILPSDTRYMHHLGMSDYASYWESFSNTDCKLLNYLSEVSYNKFGKKPTEVFVGRMNDPSAVIKFMDRLSQKTGVVASQNAQGYTLYDLGKSSFIANTFGEDFKDMKRCCYAIVDQYLVMASSMDAIKEVIAGYRSGRTLDLNEGFRTFQQKMLESANITFFEVKSDRTEAFQLASSKDMVYVNICMSRRMETYSENNVRWKVNLDAPLEGKPYIVESQNATNRNVVAFDRTNMMYLIDSDGAILWKKPLGESPMSEVFTVDAYNNGQTQFLFNTAQTIQLIDHKGNNMEGYPMHLPFEATNGLSLVEYNSNRDYRILLCGTDRLLYNYNIRGLEVEGWNRHRAEDQVRQPVKHLVADNKDYLIVADVSGGVRILDRQGRIRIPLTSDMQKSPQNDIYTNATNTKKGLFLTSDKEGKLLYITADGAMNRTDFGTYSDKHFFFYEDFNGDQDPDFIYLDGQDLRVFDRYKKELFSHHFDVEINTKPVFFRISRNKRLLGVVSEKAREITLIDRKGRMIVNSGLVGETPFAVGSLHGDQEINLITGVGNALFNYTIY